MSKLTDCPDAPLANLSISIKFIYITHICPKTERHVGTGRDIKWRIYRILHGLNFVVIHFYEFDVKNNQ